MRPKTYKYKVVLTTKNGNKYPIWAYTKEQAERIAREARRNDAVEAHITRI